MKASVRTAAILLACIFVLTVNGPAIAQEDENPKEKEPFPERTIRSYASLSNLIHLVCEDAISQFYDFYAPVVVNVKPFVAIDEFSSTRVTMLGLTLADQMAARVNNDSLEPGEKQGEYDQWMQGIIHELDGYLRVHISGMNSRGERKSYVVSVEMSEPLYRALHTKVGM